MISPFRLRGMMLLKLIITNKIFVGVYMKNMLLKIQIRILIWAAISGILISLSFPSTVFASGVQYSVRFTAGYVSGNTGTKNVYYILDNGSSQFLGTVSQSSSLDVTFNATFSNTIRVYVQISDDAIYNEHLYINGSLQASGNVGNGGLTYSRGDTTAPTGRITYPISGVPITHCPIIITANVSDDNSGIDWVIYLVKYDGIWHQIGTDNSTSGSNGYGTPWDCSQVQDQELDFRISARDNAGNQGNVLGGDVIANLSKGQTSPTITQTSTVIQSVPTLTSTATPVPPPTATVIPATPTIIEPTATPVPPSTLATELATLATELAANTSTAGPKQLPTQTSIPKTQTRIPLCTSALIPLILSFVILLWRKHL
jgi:hypothetical protein